MSRGSTHRFESELRRALVGSRFGDARWVTTTGSTNDDLVELARAGESEQVRIADEQTSGRGRRGRTWVAPSGSAVLLSVLLRDDVPPDPFWAVGAVSLAACAAVDEAIGRGAAALERPSVDEITTGTELPRCEIKWPNDLLIGRRKLAGVLAQVVDGGLVVGVGINVHWPTAMPTEIAERATSLDRHIAGDAPENARLGLVVDLLAHLELLLDRPWPSVMAQWVDRCCTVGQLVRVERTTTFMTGTAIGVTDRGALILQGPDGVTEHEVGDVVHLRADT